MDGRVDGRTDGSSFMSPYHSSRGIGRAMRHFVHTHTHTHIYIYVYRYTGRLSQTGRSLSSCIRASVLFLFLLLLLFFIACSALTFAVTVATANPSEWIFSILSSHRLWWEREEKEKQGEKKKEREREGKKRRQSQSILIRGRQHEWCTLRKLVGERRQRSNSVSRITGEAKKRENGGRNSRRRREKTTDSAVIPLLCQSQRNNFSSSLFSCSAGIV